MKKTLVWVDLGIEGMLFFVGIVGIFLTLGLYMVSSSIIDTLHTNIKAQFNSYKLLLESTIGVVEELEQTATHVSDSSQNISASLNSLSNSLNTTSEQMISLGGTLASINLGLISLSDEGNAIVNAGEELSYSATLLLSSSKEVEKGLENLDDVSKEIGKVKDSLIQLKADTVKAEKDVNKTFENLRLVNLLFSLILFLIFFINTFRAAKFLFTDVVEVSKTSKKGAKTKNF